MERAAASSQLLLRLHLGPGWPKGNSVGKQWSGEGLGGKTGTDRSLQFGPVWWVALFLALGHC